MVDTAAVMEDRQQVFFDMEMQTYECYSINMI
jgi:hypothetical protein